jgi:hypothetical protein
MVPLIQLKAIENDSLAFFLLSVLEAIGIAKKWNGETVSKIVEVV